MISWPLFMQFLYPIRIIVSPIILQDVIPLIVRAVSSGMLGALEGEAPFTAVKYQTYQKPSLTRSEHMSSTGAQVDSLIILDPSKIRSSLGDTAALFWGIGGPAYGSQRLQSSDWIGWYWSRLVLPGQCLILQLFRNAQASALHPWTTTCISWSNKAMTWQCSLHSMTSQIIPSWIVLFKTHPQRKVLATHGMHFVHVLDFYSSFQEMSNTETSAYTTYPPIN